MRKLFISIIIIILIFSIVGVCLYFIHPTTYENEDFSNKFSGLENHILNDSELKSKLNSSLGNNDINVFISICDMNSKSIVFNSSANTLNNAISNTKNKVAKYLKKNNYDIKWIRVHIVDSIEQKSRDDVYTDIKGFNENFTKGISFDKNFNTALLYEELLCNSIISDNNELDLSAINNYLESINKNTISSVPDSLITFSTISYFCDENNNIFDLEPNSENGIVTRPISTSVSDIKNLISSSNSYLANSLNSNGRFAYGYYATTDNYIIDYNMLRHIGSTWGLIVNYKNNATEEFKSDIDSAISYITKNIAYKDDNTAYVIDVANYAEDSTITIGGNGLACIMFIEYMETFNSNEYDDLLNDLGNGILSLQNDNGKFTHEIKPTDFSVINDFVSELYDGECSFALCRLYGYTHNSRYLLGAAKAVNYFIDNNYYEHSMHWISYTMNEITKYISVDEYYTFALKNIQQCIDTTEYDNIDSTTLELLTIGFETYSRITQKNISLEYLDNTFEADKFIRILKSKVKLNTTAYTYPEIAMYFSIPSKFINVFSDFDDNFRIRIDDIQHFTLGYTNYINIYDKLSKY